MRSASISELSRCTAQSSSLQDNGWRDNFSGTQGTLNVKLSDLKVFSCSVEQIRHEQKGRQGMIVRLEGGTSAEGITHTRFGREVHER
jgi:hypothetical protein